MSIYVDTVKVNRVSIVCALHLVTLWHLLVFIQSTCFILLKLVNVRLNRRIKYGNLKKIILLPLKSKEEFP